MKMEDFVCPPDTFRPACPPHLRSTFSQEEDSRFRFTPVKVTRTAPRIWDRKPSTSFRARGKSRKVWKRFRTSFNSMKALQQLVGPERHTIDEELQLEINTARNPGLLRGTKRRCFALETDESEGSVRGRSFLETQWESEFHGRRRKLPLVYSDFVDIPDEPVEFDSLQPSEARDDVSDAEDEPTSPVDDALAENSAAADESSSPIPDTPTKLAPGAAYPRLLHGQPALAPGGLDDTSADIKTPEFNDQPALALSDASAEEPRTPDETETDHDIPPVEAMMYRDQPPAEQPTVTVDAETLKEHAAAAPTLAPVQDLTAEQESTLVRSALRSSLDGEDAALLSSFLSKAKAKREAKAAAMVAQDAEKPDPETTVAVIVPPTPPPRRALEDLDTNSPSPQKPQQSPTKPLENGSPQPSSPRRSTRPRTTRSSPVRTATAAAAVRNTLSLRRAKGTEFIFLQRTEAQELALSTRRNTRLNRGNALMPKFVLQGLARKSQESKKQSPTTPSSDDDKAADDSGRPQKTAKKHVSWNDDRLVRFQGDEDGGSDHHDVADRAGKGSDKSPEQRKAASSRTTRAQASQKSGGEDGPSAVTTAPATATPRTRRVRRLGAGAPKVDLSTVGSPSSPSSSSDSPVQRRKKLTPKSPKSAMDTPSKSVGGIKTSLRSSSAKTNLLKVNAGSTPVARKIRPRS
ncbi:hypothetical protein BO71DRAFT_394648 [Aspergillus ellipticus CBS 707.79]|uniref:Uncharacterized protein n=1 Tax=Aspergillus ellipticus CBS 707.79 TaxID=1448320 RepID=A0A319DNR4_9EURO|nr:hypothetical protein BO71DRAFT_394648 [Aspergillus ellipticus CBS 707.79]